MFSDPVHFALRRPHRIDVRLGSIMRSVSVICTDGRLPRMILQRPLKLLHITTAIEGTIYQTLGV